MTKNERSKRPLCISIASGTLVSTFHYITIVLLSLQVSLLQSLYCSCIVSLQLFLHNFLRHEKIATTLLILKFPFNVSWLARLSLVSAPEVKFS
jgi:hypothetical protein